MFDFPHTVCIFASSQVHAFCSSWKSYFRGGMGLNTCTLKNVRSNRPVTQNSLAMPPLGYDRACSTENFVPCTGACRWNLRWLPVVYSEEQGHLERSSCAV